MSASEIESAFPAWSTSAFLRDIYDRANPFSEIGYAEWRCNVCNAEWREGLPPKRCPHESTHTPEQLIAHRSYQ